LATVRTIISVMKGRRSPNAGMAANAAPVPARNARRPAIIGCTTMHPRRAVRHCERGLTDDEYTPWSAARQMQVEQAPGNAERRSTWHHQPEKMQQRAVHPRMQKRQQKQPPNVVYALHIQPSRQHGPYGRLSL